MSKKENKKTGNLGEQIACKHLIVSGFKIIEKNYLKKFGEIDIVAKKNKKNISLRSRPMSFPTTRN